VIKTTTRTEPTVVNVAGMRMAHGASAIRLVTKRASNGVSGGWST